MSRRGTYTPDESNYGEICPPFVCHAIGADFFRVGNFFREEDILTQNLSHIDHDYFGELTNHRTKPIYHLEN